MEMEVPYCIVNCASEILTLTYTMVVNFEHLQKIWMDPYIIVIIEQFMKFLYL